MILIDGMMLARRCHAKMDFLKNSVGQRTGMEYGFLRSVEKLQKELEGDVIICWDSIRNVRKEKYPVYKANRSKMPGDYYTRLEEFKRFLRCMFGSCQVDGIEADDLLYSIAKQTIGETVYIYTNDSDLLQAVGGSVFVVKSFQSKLYHWDLDKVVERFLVPLSKLVYFRMFIGDSSDNLDGVERIQKKKLAKIINSLDTSSLAQVIAHVVNSDVWTPLIQDRIMDFVNDGKAVRNYRLMKLEMLDCDVCPPIPDEDFVVKKLMEWEISRLKMCVPYKEKLNARFADSEF